MGTRTKAFRTGQMLDALGMHKPFTVTVQGESMLPHIQPGDEVQVLKTDWVRVHRGDVVAVPCEDGFRIHRFLGKFKLCRTGGDACAKWDVPISPHRPVYRVISLYRNGKQRNVPHSTWLGWFHLIRQVIRALKFRLLHR